MDDIKKAIRQYVVTNFLFGKDEGLTDTTSFLDKGIIDSTGVLELAAHLESTYSIKVKDEELLPENLDSINAVATYLQGKLA